MPKVKAKEKPNKHFLLEKFTGRPPKYSKVTDLEKKALEYFEKCSVGKEFPNKAGLCLYLGISRDTYSTYRKSKTFSDTIKKCDKYIEDAWVNRLGGAAATGAIFYLKNAFRDHYKDRQETDITSGGEQIVGFNYVKPKGKGTDS